MSETSRTWRKLSFTTHSHGCWTCKTSLHSISQLMSRMLVCNLCLCLFAMVKTSWIVSQFASSAHGSWTPRLKWTQISTTVKWSEVLASGHLEPILVSCESYSEHWKCGDTMGYDWPFSSDLKAFAKIASAILILRKGGSTAWTTDLDNQMIAWSKAYINWLETAKIAVEERVSTK